MIKMRMGKGTGEEGSWAKEHKGCMENPYGDLPLKKFEHRYHAWIMPPTENS